MNVFNLSIIGQVILNFLLFFAVWKSTQKASLWRKVALAFILVEFGIFLLFYLQRYTLSIEALSRILTIFNNYYIALVVLLTMLTVAFLLLQILYWTKGIKDPKVLRQWRGIAIGFLVPLTVGLCIWGYNNTMNPRITEYDIELPYNGTPHELKIVLVTDIHIGEIIGPNQIKKLSKMVQEQNADYILLGGDHIDFLYEYAGNYQEIAEDLRAMNRDNNLFMVLGNHEYYSQLEQKISWIKSIGTLLKDDVVRLQDSLYLIGRDDFYNRDRKPLSHLMEEVPQGSTTLLLDHQPIAPDEERENGISLAMHGHTHNGQFIPFKWATALKFEKSYGYYKKDGTQYITSSGYGVAASPFRIGTFSEIVVIHLRLV